MSVTFGEGLVDKVSAYLSSSTVGTKLAALDAEYPDAIVLNNPIVTYFGRKSLKSIQDYPALFIYCPVQRFHAKSMIGGQIFPQLNVGIFEVDTDPEALERRLYRYGRAIVELLLAGVQANAFPGWTLSTNEDWLIDTEAAEPEDTSESDFMGLVVVQVPRAYAWEE